MRKSILTGFALSVAVLCQAGLPTVESVTKVDLPAGMTVSMATISPDGTYAVVSPLSGTGLQRLDLSTKQVSEISKTASPLLVEITGDGNNVLFRESSYDKDHRRYVSLKSYDVAGASTTTLVDRSRSLNGFASDGATAVAVENGRRSAKALRGNGTSQGRATLSINLGKLCVTDPAGNTTEIAPLGDDCNSYLWPSLSPDGTRIVAFGVGTGSFVYDLNGGNVTVLDMVRAPKWLDNNTIVAMDDHDNGVQTVKSTIMAYTADGSAKAALTDDSVVAVFPTVASGKVAFTTPEGEMYIINLK